MAKVAAPTTPAPPVATGDAAAASSSPSATPVQPDTAVAPPTRSIDHTLDAAVARVEPIGGTIGTPSPVVIHLPRAISRWTVAGSTLTTRVDLSSVPRGQRPRLVLPDGLPAPAWMVLDMKTGLVSGSVPGNADALGYLTRAQVHDR